MLIKAGGKELLFKININGASVLHSAAQNGHAGVSKEVVEQGGKDLVLLLMNGGRSALHLAT